MKVSVFNRVKRTVLMKDDRNIFLTDKEWQRRFRRVYINDIWLFY